MKYARVMHHIGGLSGKNDNADMIRGGEDELNLVTETSFPAEMKEADVKRLFDLGALREATADEVKQWEISKGIRVASDDMDAETQFTTGNETLHGVPGAAPVGGGADDAQSGGAGADKLGDPGAELGNGQSQADAGQGQTYKGMSKGQLSESTVPELKQMAKDEGVEGYADMTKDPLLDALLALGK